MRQSLLHLYLWLMPCSKAFNLITVGTAQVTFIEALDQLMPGFDPEIGKLAQRVLINPRKIDSYTGVFASKVLKSHICLLHADKLNDAHIQYAVQFL